MNQTSFAKFKNNTRVHIGFRTSDLEAAIRFYSLLLGGDPVKQKVDYAKWESDDPSVNLYLTAGSVSSHSAGTHYGIQVKSTEAIASAKARFESAGVPFQSEDESVCCYALQDKFWVADPDGNEWEVFVVLDDADSFRSETSECCASEAPQ
jgi:catechol 2,3-dioxygenase-like lactoylglutathione lyase family enzyme